MGKVFGITVVLLAFAPAVAEEPPLKCRGFADEDDSTTTGGRDDGRRV